MKIPSCTSYHWANRHEEGPNPEQEGPTLDKEGSKPEREGPTPEANPQKEGPNSQNKNKSDKATTQKEGPNEMLWYSMKTFFAFLWNHIENIMRIRTKFSRKTIQLYPGHVQ